MDITKILTVTNVTNIAIVVLALLPLTALHVSMDTIWILVYVENYHVHALNMYILYKDVNSVHSPIQMPKLALHSKLSHVTPIIF